MATIENRVFFVLGSVAGALGVALSAAAAHSGGAHMATVANFMLFHAPALLALSLVPRGTLLTLGGWVLVAGLLFFNGDLLARDLLGDRLFPFAAPLGGTAMILGWIVVAISGLMSRK